MAIRVPNKARAAARMPGARKARSPRRSADAAARASRGARAGNGRARSAVDRAATVAGGHPSEAQTSWEQKFTAARERPGLYPFTISGIPIKPLYGPDDVARHGPRARAGLSGRVPVHARRARSNVPRADVHDAPVRRFGRAHETNQRFHYLLSHGSRRRSRSTTHDMATPATHPKAHARSASAACGRQPARLEILPDGLNPGAISTSMTITARRRSCMPST